MTSKRDIGRQTMKEVLGDAYFEKREKDTNDFNRPMKLFTEEACYADVWSRPGLDRRTRSLMVMSTLIALNREAEFKSHVLAALNNGCTVSEIQEAIYQAAIYCGAPAGVEAFKSAEQVLRAAGAL